MKAIILAGGEGTRLRPVIGNMLPKCMAPVMGRPMISLVINSMKNQGINDITLALGYKADSFLSKFGHMKYKIEDEPLGTGGAIKNCAKGDDPILIANGDTVTDIDYFDMLDKHHRQITIAVTPNGTHAGIYIIDPKILRKIARKKFSFEKELISLCTFSFYKIKWFTDLGTPEEYQKACRDWV